MFKPSAGASSARQVSEPSAISEHSIVSSGDSVGVEGEFLQILLQSVMAHSSSGKRFAQSYDADIMSEAEQTVQLLH
jgi:hypothetical protein